jgi:glycosyltransferase involved in cell wall biosynthesis
MRFVHVATRDIGGGASRAAYRIHSGLRKIGYDSVMFVERRTSDDPTVIEYKPPMDLRNRAYRFARRQYLDHSVSRYKGTRPLGYEPFTVDRTPYGRDWFTQLPSGAVINLHWISGFVDYRRLFSAIRPHVPIVWRLADMNPFTGGCHFDDGCGKFATGCGRCPQLGSSDPGDLSHEIWERKFMALKQIGSRRLHIVVLNQSMVETVKASPLLGRFPVTLIPNGLDTDEFAPRDKATAREILDVPTESRILLFAADRTQNPRKGLRLLVEALNGLDRVTNLFLLSIGAGYPEIPARIAHRHLGRIYDDRMLSIVYSAADLFVFPSLQETFGQTALEAMACGTPVVGFEGVGGIPDLIRCGVTGRKVPIGNVTALRLAIAELLQDAARLAEMSIHCRRTVVEKFNLELQAKRYAELYRSLIDPTTIDAGSVQ